MAGSTIIAPTDFSPAADRATRRAASLAAAFDAQLQLMHVMPPREVLEEVFRADIEGEASSIRARAEQALQERAQRLTAQCKTPPACSLHFGPAHRAILDAAESLNADLVVLGGWGEHEGAATGEGLGGTALKVAERNHGATLLVKRDPLMPYGRILGCARGGAAADRSVLKWAMRLSPQELVHLVSAYSVGYERRLIEWGASPATLDLYAGRAREVHNRMLLDLLAELAIPAARVTLHVERGDPLEVILRSAARWESDLIVLGRRAGVDSLAPGPFGIGSVARQVALRAAADVLVVPPPRGADHIPQANRH